MLDTHYHFDFLPLEVRADFLAELGDQDVKVVAQSVTPSGFIKLEHAAAYGEPAPSARSLGFHPWYIGDDADAQLELFAHAVTQTRFIGEIGLDFSPRRLSTIPATSQLHVLQTVLESVSSVATPGKQTAASRTDAPYILSLHAVHSASAVLDLLSDLGLPRQEIVAVIHRFNGTSDELVRFIRMGGYISVHPSMLRTKRGRAYIQQIPTERLLLETDLPASPPDLSRADLPEPSLFGATYARAVTESLASTLASLGDLLGDDAATTIAQTAQALYGCY